MLKVESKTNMGENSRNGGPSQQGSLLEVKTITTSPDLGHGLADKIVETSKNTNVVKQQQHRKQTKLDKPLLENKFYSRLTFNVG